MQVSLSIPGIPTQTHCLVARGSHFCHPRYQTRQLLGRIETVYSAVKDAFERFLGSSDHTLNKISSDNGGGIPNCLDAEIV